MSFRERASKMGLEQIDPDKYRYIDRFCQVFYKQVKTNDEALPFWGVFCTPTPESNEEYFGGFVSEFYKFIGNEVLVAKAKDSILETSAPIVGEHHLLNYPKNTRFEYRFNISHGGQTIPEVGELIPQITLSNSYDGTASEKLAFGLSLIDAASAGVHVTFRTKLGTFAQIHTARAKTRLAGLMGSFFEIFSENIVDLVNSTRAKTLSDDEILRTLDLVESVGKKRREEVSTFLADLTKGGQSISAWHMFLAIAKFSAQEQNLNVKTLMENIAERVLVLPVRMMEALKKA